MNTEVPAHQYNIPDSPTDVEQSGSIPDILPHESDDAVFLAVAPDSQEAACAADELAACDREMEEETDHMIHAMHNEASTDMPDIEMDEYGTSYTVTAELHTAQERQEASEYAELMTQLRNWQKDMEVVLSMMELLSQYADEQALYEKDQWYRKVYNDMRVSETVLRGDALLLPTFDSEIFRRTYDNILDMVYADSYAANPIVRDGVFVQTPSGLAISESIQSMMNEFPYDMFEEIQHHRLDTVGLDFGAFQTGGDNGVMSVQRLSELFEDGIQSATTSYDKIDVMLDYIRNNASPALANRECISLWCDVMDDGVYHALLGVDVANYDAVATCLANYRHTLSFGSMTFDSLSDRVWNGIVSTYRDLMTSTVRQYGTSQISRGTTKSMLMSAVQSAVSSALFQEDVIRRYDDQFMLANERVDNVDSESETYHEVMNYVSDLSYEYDLLRLSLEKIRSSPGVWLGRNWGSLLMRFCEQGALSAITIGVGGVVNIGMRSVAAVSGRTGRTARTISRLTGVSSELQQSVIAASATGFASYLPTTMASNLLSGSQLDASISNANWLVFTAMFAVGGVSGHMVEKFASGIGVTLREIGMPPGLVRTSTGAYRLMSERFVDSAVELVFTGEEPTVEALILGFVYGLNEVQSGRFDETQVHLRMLDDNHVEFKVSDAKVARMRKKLDEMKADAFGSKIDTHKLARIMTRFGYSVDDISGFVSRGIDFEDWSTEMRNAIGYVSPSDLLFLDDALKSINGAIDAQGGFGDLSLRHVVGYLQYEYRAGRRVSISEMTRHLESVLQGVSPTIWDSLSDSIGLEVLMRYDADTINHLGVTFAKRAALLGIEQSSLTSWNSGDINAILAMNWPWGRFSHIPIAERKPLLVGNTSYDIESLARMLDKDTWPDIYISDPDIWLDCLMNPDNIRVLGNSSVEERNSFLDDVAALQALPEVVLDGGDGRSTLDGTDILQTFSWGEIQTFGGDCLMNALRYGMKSEDLPELSHLLGQHVLQDFLAIQFLESNGGRWGCDKGEHFTEMDDMSTLLQTYGVQKVKALLAFNRGDYTFRTKFEFERLMERGVTERQRLLDVWNRLGFDLSGGTGAILSASSGSQTSHGSLVKGLFSLMHLAELVDLPRFDEVVKYITDEEPTLSVGVEQVRLAESLSIHMLRGLVLNAGDSANAGKDMSQVLHLYERNINAFINTDVRYTHGFFVGSPLQDWNGAFRRSYGENRGRLQEMIEADGGTFTAYMDDETLLTPDQIIDEIERTLRAHPDDPIYVEVALHGGEDGSGGYSHGDFEKRHYQRLYSLAARYPTLDLLSDRCYAGAAGPVGEGNIRLTSTGTVSSAAFDRVYMRGRDLNGDGSVSFRETVMTALLAGEGGYSSSFMPTQFIHPDDGQTHIIAQQDGVIDHVAMA